MVKKSSSFVEKGHFCLLRWGGDTMVYESGGLCLPPAGVSYSGRTSILQDSTWASKRRGAPAALLMSMDRPSYC